MTTPPVPSMRTLLLSPSLMLAFGFGSGLSPIAPGTAGSAVGLLIYLPMSSLPLLSYLLITTVITVTGIAICDKVSKTLQVHDHPGIVIDEIAGMLITLIAAPVGVLWALAGFGLFRLFDIVKPWPIGWADKQVSGGLGIMLDDMIAGVFACACLQVLIYLVRLSGLSL